jgi:hypothetical protein
VIGVDSHRGPTQGQSFLTLAGGLGAEDVPWARELVTRALEGEPHDLVIDMRGAYDVCREALALLAEFRTRQRTLNRHLTLVIDRDSAADRALQAAGLRGLFLTVRHVPNRFDGVTPRPARR